MFYCYYDPNSVIRVLLECCGFEVILHTIEPGFEFLVIAYTVVLRLDFQILLYAQVQLQRRCILEVIVLLLNSLFPPSPEISCRFRPYYYWLFEVRNDSSGRGFLLLFSRTRN
jgi:hypothetical protein